MTDKKDIARTVLVLLLVANIFAAQAISPVLIALIVGAGGGAVLGYLAGHHLGYEEAKEQYEVVLSTLKSANDLEIKKSLLSNKYSTEQYYALARDYANFTADSAWNSAVIAGVKAAKAGEDPISAAVDVLVNYYYNVTNVSVMKYNVHQEMIASYLNEHAEKAGVSVIKFEAEEVDGFFYESFEYVPDTAEWKHCYGLTCSLTDDSNVEFYVKPYKTVSACGFTFQLYAVYVSVAGTEYRITTDVEYGDVDVSINESLLIETLNALDFQYHRIFDNFETVMQQIAAQAGTLDVEDLITPLTLASTAATDAQSTGYYAYAAAALVSLGLPLAGGINTTMEIQLDDGTQMAGMLFTTWDITYEVGETYTVPSGELVYFLDESGLLYKLDPGSTFTITKIKDFRGNELQSTTVNKYVRQVNVDEVAQQLEEIRTLQKQWEEIQVPAIGAGATQGTIVAWLYKLFGANWQLWVAGIAIFVLALAVLSSRK
ncbi:hypothetical protein [Archaeoglobus veneficus]|uniref:Envelope protein N-terminal domain-containing protein n=2 Tax=root TaxID=1 RepID=F2KMP4_ARCVS|nr:hypothetical protein [Archaeoglobus veneficus]AEA46068.1 hypothetical protein Arcve_0024 [Archaeoglobus veneficus SNP6]